MGIEKKIENNFKDLYEKYFEGIIDEYNEYITTISSGGAAASIECSVFLLILMELFNCKSVLDLGSGFSSYILRFYRKRYGTKDMKIWSIDTDKDWLLKTKKFVEKKGLLDENFSVWNKFKNEKRDFDLVFIDIDQTKNRPDHIPIILENFVTEKTIVLFDDFHKKWYTDKIMPFIDKTYLYNSYDIKKYTLEKNRGKMIRYCWLSTNFQKRG